jgi:hypothetical protein
MLSKAKQKLFRTRRSSHSAGGSTPGSNSVMWFGNRFRIRAIEPKAPQLGNLAVGRGTNRAYRPVARGIQGP